LIIYNTWFALYNYSIHFFYLFTEFYDVNLDLQFLGVCLCYLLLIVEPATELFAVLRFDEVDYCTVD